MNDPWFNSLCAMTAQMTGVVIDADKQYLAEARLAPLLPRFGVDSFRQLVSKAEERERSNLAIAVVEAMMTGETLFFRDISLFSEIRANIIPRLIEQCASRKSLRIWCPACSTGQEPYSLAMIIDEHADVFAGWDIKILGIDISPRAIERAKSGVYNQFEVQRGLPVQKLLRHFEQQTDNWQINRTLRSKVTFETGNLLHGRHPGEKYDLVLCRNVLIYFDQKTRTRALQALNHHVADDGWLILGTSETNIIRSDTYNYISTFPAAYQK